MAFKSPELLLFLLVVPVAVAGALVLERRRARQAARWSAPALLGNMVPGRPGRRRAVPLALFLGALTLLLVGFARPEARFTEVRDGATVVLMVDVSGSMAADDVRPSRLGAADAALREFLGKLPAKIQASLVTFSAVATVKVAPTYDRTVLIDGLPTKTELQGTAMGSALAEAIAVATKAVGPSKPGAPHPPASILLVSDGGQNAGKLKPTQVAAEARKAGIPISTVALGTPHGTVKQSVPIGNGKKTFPLIQQVPVDATTLKEVAAASGGTFFSARSAGALSEVYKSLGERLVHERQFREVTVWLTGAALVTMLVASVLSLLWFRRVV